MPKKVTTQDWINKIENKFPGKYTFEKTKYFDQFIEMTITCKIHGDIKVVPKYVISRNRDCNYCKGFVPDIEINQEQLRKWYVYEPETGNFKVRATGKILGTKTDGYLVVNMKGKVFAIHRLIYMYMLNTFPEVVDHRDRDRSNNKWENLRGGDYFLNNHNIEADGAYESSPGRYTSRVYHRGEYIVMGTFDTFNEAREKSQEFYNTRIKLGDIHSI